jgi:hypothetical protein
VKAPGVSLGHPSLTHHGNKHEALDELSRIDMGNANAHSNDNLPFLLAGGAFKHAGHLAFDKKRNEPLANAFVSVLQHLGVEADRFASSTGAMKGLELARNI